MRTIIAQRQFHVSALAAGSAVSLVTGLYRGRLAPDATLAGTGYRAKLVDSPYMQFEVRPVSTQRLSQYYYTCQVRRYMLRGDGSANFFTASPPATTDVSGTVMLQGGVFSLDLSAEVLFDVRFGVTNQQSVTAADFYAFWTLVGDIEPTEFRLEAGPFDVREIDTKRRQQTVVKVA